MKLQRLDGVTIGEGESLRAIAEKHRAGLWRANLLGADLSEINLSGANLSEAYLSRANLSRASLLGACLSGANLSGANISEADLEDADLSRANLSEACLSGASLFWANLSRAKLVRADIWRADLSGAYLAGAYEHQGCIFSACTGGFSMHIVHHKGGVFVTSGCHRGLSIDEARKHWAPQNKRKWTTQSDEYGAQRLRTLEFLIAEATAAGWFGPSSCAPDAKRASE